MAGVPRLASLASVNGAKPHVGKWRPILSANLLAANPPVLAPGQWGLIGCLDSHLRPGQSIVRAMPGKCRLIPEVAATGAIRDVLSLVQECGWKIVVAAAVQVDHVTDVLTGVAVQEEPGTRGAPLLALLGICRELHA